MSLKSGDIVKKKTAILLILALMVVLLSHPASSQEGPLVKTIEIIGLKRIEDQSIRNRLLQKTGQPLSREAIEKDIKSIYRMGYFEDVKVELEPFEGGLKIIYLVKEKPTIVSIKFEGNKEFDQDKLSEHINITPGVISDASLIQDNLQQLRDFYEGEGYWHVRIVPVLKKINPAEVALTILIDEGKKVKIKEIRIEGNQALSDRKIKKAMKTRSWWIFSFLTSSWTTAGFYKKSEMEADLERIRNLYYDHGFLNIKIGDPEIKLISNRRKMIITISLSEGPQYRVSSVRYKGNDTFNEKSFTGLLPLKTGDIFSRKKLNEGIKKITEYYTERGYAMVSVLPNILTNEKNNTVGILMNIKEGAVYRIGRIEITGNTKTQDKVIRREMRLDEGDVFNSKLLKRSYERINILNYFETVELTPKPKVEERSIDIDINVKEKATGMLSLGGGYSTLEGFVGMIDVTQSNLFGTGRHLKAGGQFSTKSTLYEITYTDQWFLDRPITFTFSTFKTKRDYVSYDRKAVGGSLGLGKRFMEYWLINTTYRYEKATIYDVSSDADDIIKDQEGTSVTSSISPTLTRDSRDSLIDPTKGSKNSVFLTISGLGGTNKFIKSVIDSGWYFPVGKTTVLLRGRVGYATGFFNKELPLYERFYIGGINTIRGLGFGEGGPRGSDGKVIGGTKELILNAEYIFPIYTEAKLKGVVFFDAGRAYDTSETFGSDLRYTSGAGIRWFSPMGPLRIEYGFNLDRRFDESASKVEFTFGTMF
jgi:outer membrane protein insertion porin family